MTFLVQVGEQRTRLRRFGAAGSSRGCSRRRATGSRARRERAQSTLLGVFHSARLLPFRLTPESAQRHRLQAPCELG